MATSGVTGKGPSVNLGNFPAPGMLLSNHRPRLVLQASVAERPVSGPACNAERSMPKYPSNSSFGSDSVSDTIRATRKTIRESHDLMAWADELLGRVRSSGSSSPSQPADPVGTGDALYSEAR